MNMYEWNTDSPDKEFKVLPTLFVEQLRNLLPLCDFRLLHQDVPECVDILLYLWVDCFAHE